jgi:hypothetical protein
MFTGDTFDKLNKESAQKPKPEQNAPPKIQMGLTKEDEIRIGLEMIPMFQAKESELTS